MPPVCQVCRHPRAADIALALVAGDSSRSIAKRFETSASAIFRHRRHALKGSAIVRAVEARADREAETLVEEIRRLKADAARLAAKAEAEHDYRGALGAVKLLTDVALRLEELTAGSNEAETRVRVEFSFPDSGLSRDGEAFEARLERQREAATERTTDAATSATTDDAEVSRPIVAHEERQPEERAASEKAPVSAPEAALPSPFQRFGPLGPPGPPGKPR